jgi:hypothetical protein
MWQAARSHPFNKTVRGSATLSGTFRALYDQTYFYALFVVDDDNPTSSSGWSQSTRKAWYSSTSSLQDGIELYIDGDNNPDMPIYDYNDGCYIVNYGWGSSVVELGDSRNNASGSSIEKIKDVSTSQGAKTGGGYTIGLKIPWKHFEVTPSHGTVIGINFAANQKGAGTVAWQETGTRSSDYVFAQSADMGVGYLYDPSAVPVKTVPRNGWQFTPAKNEMQNSSILFLLNGKVVWSTGAMKRFSDMRGAGTHLYVRQHNSGRQLLFGKTFR